ncbi:uncharacterized protein GLRG_01397 [Colletotrichum graminicola M1.001]|uniref:Uncharacterized protein n=1 Tax=Colletotrichum graminicola (strain M1.001 / M2 / FGSC 10212) TaxID=645133 RepID=E3Q605_COLGM|nr:uncharacterized protein GLRG_01397 [Colletotrichum graminicola M1.001]EFQ26253.1 hypothetical protein GLRG_01397 [Colletotrichum graminicola M1.001]
MGGFNKVTDLAQQLAGKEQTGQGQENQQDSSQISGSNQKWAEVGLEAKKAFADYQADQAAGKGPEYNRIGGVAQKAFSAYSSGGEKRDLADIGKQVAAGFGGGEEVDTARNSSEVGNGMSQSGRGQRSFGTDGSDVDLGDGTMGDTLHSTTAEAKTSSKSERFSGQEALYEAAGHGLQTERDTQDGTVFEKGDLDEDEGVCTGGQGKRREATSGTAANQGKKKNHTT